MDIHRCRFVPYPPSAINALAFSHSSTPESKSKGPPNLRLAVGRANGDIEIWNPSRGAWYQENIIRGGKDRSIEGLAWIQDPEDVDKNGYKIAGKIRLFSIGYSTAVTEWDLASGRPLRHSTGNYGEIWCMAAQPKGQTSNVSVKTEFQKRQGERESQTQNIVVGCADGSIVLLLTGDDDLRFSRVLARPSNKKSRVLSLTFQNRHTIVAGHADSTIRVYDLRSKQQLRKMTLGAGPKNGPKETLVWSVKCLADGTIVSGDSTGTLGIWDGKTYSLLQRLQGHEADILDLAVGANGQTIFSGGMDRRTSMYGRAGSGRKGERLRWIKITHQRFHRHDVKAMATYETKGMSIIASGGLDAAPIIVPVQEFGSENHRTLSCLPQLPIIRSSPRRRLLLSWWDREIWIWRMSRHRKNVEQDVENEERSTEGRKLVAKIALQGEESVASVDLSSDGTILGVSTTSDLRLFHLRSKAGSLKVRKIEAPSQTLRSGAKLVQFSPDSRWLAVVKMDNSLQLLRITESQDAKTAPQLLAKIIHLKRIKRDPIKSNYQHGTLGAYDRSITRLAFSADSQILVVGDLSGFLDAWVLQDHQEPTRKAEMTDRSSSASTSSSDDSDDDSDDEDSTVVLDQRWIRNPSASLLIKLPASPLVLSFRPVSTQSTQPLTNGDSSVHTSRNTAHQQSRDTSHWQDRLFVATAENQMYEFNVLSGKMTDWSRRNPASRFPREFRVVRDRAMGAIWDVHGENERIWLYGTSWLWMFDLSRDLQKQEDTESKALLMNGEGQTKQLKRKRPDDTEDDKDTTRPRYDTGAGSKKSRSQLGLGIGTEIRKIEGNGKERVISLAREPEDSSESEDDDNLVLAKEDDSALVSLQHHAEDGSQSPHDHEEGQPDGEGMPTRPSHWHTLKYRPILGIVPLGGESDDEAADEREDDSDEGSPRGVEVALVERPLWDVDLPPQFYGNHEWNS